MNYFNSNLEDEFMSNMDGDVVEYTAVNSSQNYSNATGTGTRKSKLPVSSKKPVKKKRTSGGAGGFLDKALDLGKSLIESKKNAGETTTPTQQEAPTPTNESPSKEGMSMGVKIAIGVGVLAVLGGIVYFATKKK